MTTRRRFLKISLFSVALLVAERAGAMGFFTKREELDRDSFPYKLSQAEWEKKLDKMQYYVLRKAGTERAFSSPLYAERRKGVFHCAGCDQALFSSEHKFESGTGWPSFWQPIAKEAVGEDVDYKIGYARTEAHCSNCGGHLGHIFPDGPEPTGLRYCINGVVLNFKPV